MVNFGLELTKMDGTEHIFGANAKEAQMPLAYSYEKYLPKVINQGDDPICVPCSISVFLNWKENLKTGSKKDNKIRYSDIYKSKTIEGEGMTFKEAFKYLRHNGVKSKAGNLRIEEYAVVRSLLALRLAILSNGPCVGALPVYNYTNEFWKKRNGDALLAYHAISIVGYDENSFIIRNSWGDTWGNKGYFRIKNEDIGKFKELWTIL